MATDLWQVYTKSADKSRLSHKLMENVINATQAADEIGVSLTTLTDWCRRGLVPGATKLGNMWLIPIDALERIERPKMGRPASEHKKSR